MIGNQSALLCTLFTIHRLYSTQYRFVISLTGARQSGIGNDRFPKNAGSGLQMTDENGLDPSDQSQRIKRAALIKPVGHIVTRYAGLNSGYALLENLPMPPIRQENAHKSILLSPALVYCANMPKTPCLPTPPFPPSPSPSVSLSSPDAFRPTALSYSSKSLS